MSAFEAYRNTTKEPVSMLRTTPIDWRTFRLWPTYLMNPKWRVPYAPRRIAAHRLLAASPASKSGPLAAAAAGEATESFDAAATTSALEYLDRCLEHGSPATLAGLLGYVDLHRKVMPALDEVNEALEKHACMRVSRENRSVTFTVEGSDRTITDDDFEHACREYRLTFGKLRRNKQ